MRICGIYGIFNMIDGKVLIGSSTNIFRRWGVHRRDVCRSKHKNPHFQSAWNKYGKDSFEFRILEECFVASLIPREDYWMAFHKSLDKRFGYNMQNATHSFRSEETKQKISFKHLGKSSWAKGAKFTEEHKQNISIAKRGTRRSEETKRKISSGLTGRPCSVETRLKIGLKHKGMKHTEESKQKMSLSLTGRIMNFETRKKMSDSGKKAWLKRRKLQIPILQLAVNQ